mgnify:CR=1 FL=1
MKKSTKDQPLSRLVESLTERARQRGLSDSGWAAKAGLPKETLSRLRRRSSCDFTTLLALADAVDASLNVVDREGSLEAGHHFPATVSREYEERLLDLCAGRELDAMRWSSHGPSFFMAGLAVMVASESGVDRRGLLGLAERLHPGASEPAVFAQWLAQSPVRPSRFLPSLRERSKHAA